MTKAYEARVVPSEIEFLLYNINARAKRIQGLYDENKADRAKIAELERGTRKQEGSHARNND